MTIVIEVADLFLALRVKTLRQKELYRCRFSNAENSNKITLGNHKAKRYIKTWCLSAYWQMLLD